MFATPGQSVTIPLEITSRGNERLISLSLEYDMALLGVPTSAACGLDAANCTVTLDRLQSGRVGIAFTLATPLDAGVREFARITFPTFINTAPDTPISMGDLPIARTVRDGNGDPLPSFYQAGVVTFSPVPVVGSTVSGKVLAPGGVGLGNVVVRLIAPDTTSRTTTTGPFGIYTFENVPNGFTYTLTVASKRFRYEPRRVTVNSNLTNIDLISLQ